MLMFTAPAQGWSPKDATQYGQDRLHLADNAGIADVPLPLFINAQQHNIEATFINGIDNVLPIAETLHVPLIYHQNDSYPQFSILKPIPSNTKCIHYHDKQGIRGLLTECCNLLLTKRATYW